MAVSNELYRIETLLHSATTVQSKKIDAILEMPVNNDTDLSTECLIFRFSFKANIMPFLSLS